MSFPVVFPNLLLHCMVISFGCLTKSLELHWKSSPDFGECRNSTGRIQAGEGTGDGGSCHWLLNLMGNKGSKS